MGASRGLPWEECSKGLRPLSNRSALLQGFWVLGSVPGTVLGLGAQTGETVAPPGVARGLPGGTMKMNMHRILSLLSSACDLEIFVGPRAWQPSWRRRRQARCSVCSWNR